MIFMKVIFALVFLFSLQIAHAVNELRCEKDFDHIQHIFYQKEHDIFKNGTVNDLYTHIETYYYSQEFKHLHPKSVFFIDHWLPEQEYLNELSVLFDDQTQITYKTSKPFANFVLDNKEICIVKNDIELETFTEITSILGADFFIRYVGHDQWFIFPYDENISEKDFEEFFPNFPKDIFLPQVGIINIIEK